MVRGDQFAWIAAECKVSTSQDEILRSAHEAQTRNEEKLVLVSPVESSAEWSDDDDDEEEDVFRTPPERHSHSLTNSHEARIGIGVAMVEDAVDCGGKEIGEKTVDFSRDSEMDVAHFIFKRSRIGVDGLLEKDKQCVPIKAVGVIDSLKDDDCIVGGADSLNISTNLAVEKEIRECSEAAVMDENVMMEEVVVLSSDCVGVNGVAEKIVGENHECTVDGEIIRISDDAEIGARKSGKVDELRCRDNIVVERVERVGRSATISVSGNVNSNKRILPSSFRTGSNKGVIEALIGQKVGSVRSDAEGHGSGVETHKRTSGGADKGAGEAGAAENGGAGKKAFEPSSKELADNILKVLDYLVKKQEQKSAYKEKPDIIGSAIKAGLKFPRPSWKPEVSDDDSQ